MNSPGRNNYAAPNTPIASSKRSKILKKGNEVTSPARLSYVTTSGAGGTNNFESPHTPKRDEAMQQQYRVNMHLVSPSKNLFAPNGRPYQLDHSEAVAGGTHYLGSSGGGMGGGGYQVGGPSTPVRTGASVPGAQFSATSPTLSRSSNLYANSSHDSSEQDENRHKDPRAGKVEEKKVEEDNEDDDDDDVFNPYVFIARLPDHGQVRIPSKICLPAFTHATKKTLVLDLDETLVHCTIEPQEVYDYTFKVEFQDTMYNVFVRKRPYLDHFLETVCRNYEVVLFTASQRVYADKLLELLDPSRRYFNHRLFREACLNVYSNYLKDLTVLGRDPKRTMLVDNSPYAYGYQVDNGIPIESWFDDTNDTELLKLITFLNKIEMAEDVRPCIRDHFKTHELVRRAGQGFPVSLETPPF